MSLSSLNWFQLITSWHVALLRHLRNTSDMGKWEYDLISKNEAAIDKIQSSCILFFQLFISLQGYES